MSIYIFNPVAWVRNLIFFFQLNCIYSFKSPPLHFFFTTIWNKPTECCVLPESYPQTRSTDDRWLGIYTGQPYLMIELMKRSNESLPFAVHSCSTGSKIVFSILLVGCIPVKCLIKWIIVSFHYSPALLHMLDSHSELYWFLYLFVHLNYL